MLKIWLAGALRRAASGAVIEKGTRGLSRLARLHPAADPKRHGVEVVTDVVWRADGGSGSRVGLLDLYRPVRREARATVLYLHGGGFRILSKETHWAMALAFARKGFAVLVPNYRLAPRHPFPAAVIDACEVLGWTQDNAERLGIPAGRLVLAGESAGANLVTALTIAACSRRPEPWARAVFERAPRLVASLPACGLLQVSDPGRFGERGVVGERIGAISEAYLGTGGGSLDLCDVVVTLEREGAFERALPPTFIAVGSRDPILADSVRLEQALVKRGVDVRLEVYPGGIHAFHALVWTQLARRAWRDQHTFLDGVLGPG